MKALNQILFRHHLLTYFTVCKPFPSIVKPDLVTTSIKQSLVLSVLNFYFPSQCILYQLNPH